MDGIVMDKCIGCEIAEGRVKTPGGFVYQDEYWTVTHSISSGGAPLKGMLILQPKRHCTHLADLSLEETGNLGLILRETCRALNELLHPVKIYACSVGEGVKHVHFMIMPRTDGMPIGAELFKQVLEENKWTCSYQEAAEVAAMVRRNLEALLVQAA